MHDSWARVSYQMRLLGGFAVVAMLLAGMGIFAVIAHTIGDRRREIGVRLALGATPSHVITTVGSRGARPAMIGLVIGLLAAVVIGRVIASSVYGVEAVDPGVLMAVIMASLFVILLATYVAARRALVIEPSEAMRAQ